jgi:hypothetical protein
MSASLVTDSAYNANLPVKHLINRAPIFIDADASVAAAAATDELEQALLTGQDNALVYDSESAAARTHFDGYEIHLWRR